MIYPLVTALAVALGLWSAWGVADGQVGPWGLVECLPPGYWLALGACAVPLAVLIIQNGRPASVATGLVGQVLLLHGVAAAAESQPRFAVAWLHAGFTEHIQTNGTILESLDARFSWPGFFSAAAVFASGVGLEPVDLLRWAPVVMVLLYLPPLALLVRALTGEARVRWLALWVFVLADWVGQDYFAPQSLGYLMFLTVVGLLCHAFLGPARWEIPVAPPPVATGWWTREPSGDDLPHGGAHEKEPWSGPVTRVLMSWPRRWLAPTPVTTGGWDGGVRAAVLVVLVALCSATVMSHQLTPYMLIGVLFGLALTGVLRPGHLPLAVAVLSVAWLCYAASDFWLGHLDLIVGSAGQVHDVVGSGVESRVVGARIHQYVVHARIVYALALWCAAALAAVWLARAGRLRVPVVVLATAPFGLLVGQSYGGEGALRVYLFALPAMAVLVAEAAACLLTWTFGRVAGAGLLVVLLPVFGVTRFGNESFERFRPGEVQVAEMLYQVAPAGSTLAILVPNAPWRHRDLGGHEYVRIEVDPTRPLDLAAFVDPVINNPRGGFVMLTSGQVAWGEQVNGWPRDWDRTVHALLESSGRFRVVFANPDGVIYQVEPEA